MKILQTIALITLVCASASSRAATFDPIECVFCEEIKASVLNPTPILNSVLPGPLPIREVGESQEVTVNWSLPRPTQPLLRQRFSLCVTGQEPAVRLHDGCADLQNTTTILNGEEGDTYQSTVTLPGTFQRFNAYFYVRMQPVIIIGGSAFTASNLLAFNWPLYIAELEARSVKVDIGIGNVVSAEQRVTNTGTRDSAPFQNRYSLTICSQIIDPARSCTFNSTEYLDTLVVFAQSNGIAPSTTQNMFVDVSNMLPASPATLTITISGQVDYFGEVYESNEFDNYDSGTDTIFR